MVADIVQHLPDRSPRVSVIYAAWLGAGLVTFCAVLVCARAAALVVLLPLVFVSLAVNYGYTRIADAALTLDVIEWLPYEYRQLSNAGAEYAREIATAVAQALAAVGVFLVVRHAARRSRWFERLGLGRRRFSALAVATFALYHAAGMALQPPVSVAETNLFVFGVPSLIAAPPEMRSVAVAPARASLVSKVVLVVDESVTHEAYARFVAQYTRELPVKDFGEAASTANCSAASNALLRWGVERPRVPDPGYDPRTNPSIWGYAKTAGFRTVLIDGQSNGDMHNYISPAEYALIDEFVPAMAGEETDHHIAAMLNERLSRPGREFIYVVKSGAHFPYEANYPAALAPAVASRPGEYMTAVSYVTGGFFERLARALPYSDTLMIYTSDHGQDFAERAPHCNADPTADEYSVPLSVITAAPALRELLAGSPLVDRASHLNIFPTLLYAFGYARQWLETTYGPTLAGPPSSYLTYVHRAWRPGRSIHERHSVRTRDFVESSEFPRRAAAKESRMMVN